MVNLNRFLSYNQQQINNKLFLFNNQQIQHFKLMVNLNRFLLCNPHQINNKLFQFNNKKLIQLKLLSCLKLFLLYNHKHNKIYHKKYLNYFFYPLLSLKCAHMVYGLVIKIILVVHQMEFLIAVLQAKYAYLQIMLTLKPTFANEKYLL